MALPSTYALHHSLPNRSSNHRPLSLSLADYQPLNFDREAAEDAHQQSLSVPSRSTVSSMSGHSTSYTGNNSAETGETSLSTLSHKLKPGDNPHSASNAWTPPPNMAGLGTGHALTPPGSPVHSSAARLNQEMLSPIPQSPRARGPEPPTPPQEFFDQQNSGYFSSPSSPMDSNERGFRAMYINNDDGYTTDPGGPGLLARRNGRRRSLPAVPSDVPPPEPPRWEPDYKPQIPSALTAASAASAYASLSAPPPNLPPRRGGPSSAQAGSSIQGMGLARAAAARQDTGGPPLPGTHGSGPRFVAPTSSSSEQASTPSVSSHSAPILSPSSPSVGHLPDGAPDFPPTQMPVPEKRVKPHRTAVIEQGVNLVANDEKAIWSTHYIDPQLRNPIVSMPSQVTNMTNIALSGLSSGEKTRYNPTTGAPIDGMAKLARSWFVAPDAKFSSEYGGVEVSLAVVDGSAEEQWGSDKGRKKARVEIISRQGGIRFDLLEMEHNRQVDVKVESKSGDILILLPEYYLGPIHVTAGAKPPTFLPLLAAQLKPVVRPYQDVYTTFVVPKEFAADPNRNRNIEHTTMSKVQKWVPDFLREEDEFLNQAAGGIKSHTRGELSKVDARSAKGRIVLGFRDSLDEQAAEELGLKVGHKDGCKRKHWWR